MPKVDVKDLQRQLAESNQQLEADLEETKPRRGRKTLSLEDALRQSMQEPTNGVRGKNRTAVELINGGSKEVRDAMADILSACPGVKVDKRRFRLSPTFVQSMIRLYNRPETVKELTVDEITDEASAQLFEDDEG